MLPLQQDDVDSDALHKRCSINIPKFWTKGTPPPSGRGGDSSEISCWGWSDTSVDDARRQAEARAARLAQALQSGAPPDHYAYGDHPLREEIVERIPIDGRDDQALITRNNYGVLVLNTARAMFIDLDFPPRPRGGALGALLRRLFGRPPDDPERQGIERIGAWAERQGNLSLRIYRTFAGLRCLVTNQLFDPAQPETIALLTAAGSDPLYVRLCRTQTCFRARLTPKPWRCGSIMPPTRYPWINEEQIRLGSSSADQESRYRQWQSAYEQSSRPYATCRFLQQLGPATVHPEIQLLLALHDKFTGAESERPLA